MTRLTWSDTRSRFYETGVDRGVLYLKNRPAVPWNGLISVEENGSEESSVYYLDGRPFLNVPKAKEFEATIKAYTYPDEFSSVMGIEEIADGMYLDSQGSDVFDLCYRTLIGDFLNGTQKHYKLHLIYNATVATPARSYSTLSDQINPTEFSWTIQTIPVGVAGYRSTAHIVIDTRRLEQSRIAEVEALIYGDSETAPTMPNPQELLDILTFGDEVIITDFGDGTWSAEGSYHNVYMTDEVKGIFEVNHSNVVDNGDGTYTFNPVP